MNTWGEEKQSERKTERCESAMSAIVRVHVSACECKCMCKCESEEGSIMP